MPDPAPRAPFVLRKTSRFTLLSAPFAIVAGLWAVPGLAVYDAVKYTPPEPAAAAPLDGQQLFLKHCASCHGEKGDGKGTANLNPAARAFGYEPFKFATTTNAIPTDADLRRLIRRGIPGSAMPAFARDELSDADLDAVLAHVRVLTARGIYFAKDQKDGADLEPSDIRKYTEENSRVGTPLPVPAVPPPTPATVARGREVYLSAVAGCVSCHGAEGRGEVRNAKNGTPVAIRDLTSGVFKSGGEREDLYARLRLGIPAHPDSGISMVPLTPAVPDADVFALIHYVLSLKGK